MKGKGCATSVKQEEFSRGDLITFTSILYSRINDFEARRELDKVVQDYVNKVGEKIDLAYFTYLNEVDLALLKYGTELRQRFKISL